MNTKLGEVEIVPDSRGARVVMSDEMFNKLVKMAPKVLKGRRGNNSKKARTKKKLATEVMNTVLKSYIEENS